MSDYITEQQFNEAATRWMQTTRFTSDAVVNAAIAKRATEILEQNQLPPSASLFERAYLELVHEKAIQPFSGLLPVEPEEHHLTVSEYRQLSANQVVRKYQAGGKFRRDVDALIKAGSI